jgi:hypothetical protein
MFNRLKMLDRVEFCGATSKSVMDQWTMDITFGRRGRGKHWQHLLALLEGLRCTAFIA